MHRPDRNDTGCDDMRAADYVLGLMEPEERVGFERAMRSDPALARQVAEWMKAVDDAADTPHAEMRRRIVAGMTTSPAPRQTDAVGLPKGVVRIVAALAGLAVAAALLGLFLS